MKVNFQEALSTLLSAFIALILFSCSNSSSKESAAEKVAFSEAEQKIAADIDKVIHDLPPPSEVPYLLQATGADFNPGLINDIDKVGEYQTNENKAALNLGIYATDMGYLTSYDKVDKTLKYMEGCHQLAEALGVTSTFDIEMMERFQNNLSNPDSLSALMNEGIAQAEERLQASDRISVGALMLTASFIEGLYLATQVVETYPTDILDETNRNLILEPMIRVVLDQKQPLLDVITMLKNIPHDDAVLKMTSELDILRLLYEGDLADVERKIAENTGDFVITQDMLQDITTEVKRIRGEIIE